MASADNEIPKYLGLSDYSDGYQLHIWDSRHASWIPMDKALQTRSKKKVLNKSSLMTSKKYGGLDPHEIQMYQSMESVCQQTLQLAVPHDILMIILIYSQGFKFEKGEIVLAFPSGIFGESHHCVILDTIEDDKHDQVYLVSRVQIYSAEQVRRYGGSCKVALHRVFSNKLVIVDEEQFNETYGEQTGGNKFAYGDVLDVSQLQVVQNAVYSKKKKRDIKKMSVEMGCLKLEDQTARRWPRDPKRHWNTYGGIDRSRNLVVKYDSSMFVQAKWKKIAADQQ